MSNAMRDTDLPEFHVVVRHRTRRGPLAPYRFSLTVAFAFAVSGMALWRATETGIDLDYAILRTAGSALFAWIVIGRISRILGSAALPRSNDDETPHASPLDGS